MRSPRRLRHFERLESRLVMSANAACRIEPVVEDLDFVAADQVLSDGGAANGEFDSHDTHAMVDAHADEVDAHDAHADEVDAHDAHSHTDFSQIRTDADGNQYYIDPLPADVDFAEDESQPNDSDPIPMAADGDLTVPIYHSNPDAIKKIFLDFNGHTVTDTSWNSSNNRQPIHARAYSIDSDIFSFNDEELDRIFEVWERVSEDYSPFQVDVTTEDPGAAFFAQGGQGIRVLISTNVDDSRLGGTDNEWFGESGGVGYVNSWVWSSDTPVWVFSNLLGNGVKKISEAATHEVGHSLGLSHDGTTGGTEYFEGHGNWAPIMGNAYYNDVTQWSHGEYDDANNTEDDLGIISNKIPFRFDDHNDTPNGFTDPTPLTVDGETLSASGIIEQASDVDAFSFSVGPGAASVQLAFEPFHNSPNLNILARLHAENGTILYESNPQGQLNATIDTMLAPGEYYLAVAGVGEGNPSTNGYSQYATLGQYTITGTMLTSPGDLNHDSVVDAQDIDLLRIAILTSDDDPVYDLNGNGVVDQLDKDHLIYNILRTNYGDANLDQVVDTLDYQIWVTNNFQTGTGWATGDFTGDFVTDASDFNIWAQYRFHAPPPLAEAAALPSGTTSISRIPRAALARRASSVTTAWNEPDAAERVTCGIVGQTVVSQSVPTTPSTPVDLPTITQIAATSTTMDSEIDQDSPTNRETDGQGDLLAAQDRLPRFASSVRRSSMARRGFREARPHSLRVAFSNADSDALSEASDVGRNQAIDAVFRRFSTL